MTLYYNVIQDIAFVKYFNKIYLYCKAMMMTETIYSYFADREIKTIVKTHTIIRGYFKPNIKGNKRLHPP